jgi:hypothetical protein
MAGRAGSVMPPKSGARGDGMTGVEDRQIFGDENARLDTYLYRCSVPLPSRVENKPVLSGRWGVGKTAAFLLRHHELARALRAVDKEYEYIWYLDEGGLDSDTLFSLDQHYAGNLSIFKRTLERLWNTEILRVYARMLNILHEYYGSPSGKHWNTIRSRDYTDRYARPVWSVISDVVGATGDIGKAVSRAMGGISHIFSDQFEVAIQRCLADISEYPVKPAIVIEPVETPISPLEQRDASLSQAILVSLLDLFIKKFSYSPKRRQFIRVEISVPWHRSVNDNLREPQKLSQYMGQMSWDRPLLREFMVRRIENEFGLVKRQMKQRTDTDAWNVLFADSVRNTWTSCDEDSFSYMLRHTHHRTRDLMRLARNAIYSQVDISREQYPNITAEHILSGSSVSEVSPTAIRLGVEETLKSSSEDRITEAKRRFSNLSEMIDLLRGIESPFSLKMLAARSASQSSFTTTNMIETLWESGIIGFEIVPKSDDARQIIERNAPKSINEYRNKYGAKFRRYFLFEYNCELSVSQIDRIYETDMSERHIVVHPAFSENFGVRGTREYPIGV